MIESIQDAKKLSVKYDIPTEDVLLISVNFYTMNTDMPYNRVRFKFKFHTSPEEFYLGVPVDRNGSPFYLSQKEKQLYLNGKSIGTIREAENDTCDASYLRRQGTVLTLNSNSRSSCKGCGFCGTISQNPNDQHILDTESKLANFIEELYGNYETYKKTRPHLNEGFPVNKTPDISHLSQVAILTGCFGSEEKTLQHLILAKDVFSKYNFNGELFYVGCEISSENTFDTLKRDVGNFALCLSLECFTRRKELMKEIKSRITLDHAEEILKNSMEREFPTNFIYVMGLDPFDEMKRGFEKFAPYVNRFPVINVFQPHNENQKKLRNSEAEDIEYYLKARKNIESLFINTPLRPRPWENYRPLWYFTFENYDINDIRI